jgi:eukaryotic-like serine/threonine-protein kinase
MGGAEPRVEASGAELIVEPVGMAAPRRRRRSGRHHAGTPGELPQIGAIIDKYRVEELIGVGGFAVVYRATHLLLDRQVAIKLLRPRIIRTQPWQAKLLCEEARLAARINHPNVVRIHDVTHSDAITFIVMEYVEGRSLANLLEEKMRLSAEETLGIGLDVIAGLKAGLAQGVIHRDIKPANILVSSDGNTKIVDLGLAQPEGLAAGESDEPRRGGLVGTRGYVAPEQVSDPHHIDFRADIYSLGITMRHALLGVSPLAHLNRASRRDAQAGRPAVTLAPALDDLLAWMLADRAADRPASYDDLTAALRSTLARLATGG